MDVRGFLHNGLERGMPDLDSLFHWTEAGGTFVRVKQESNCLVMFSNQSFETINMLSVFGIFSGARKIDM